GFIVNLRVAPANMDMLYLAWVVFTALRWGFAPAAVASVVSSAAFDFLFVPPYLSVAMTDAWYFVTLGTMLSISILVSLLASAAREQMLMARERAAEATALYSLTQSLGAART